MILQQIINISEKNTLNKFKNIYKVINYIYKYNA